MRVTDTFVASTAHDGNGVQVSAGVLPKPTVRKLRALGEYHATSTPSCAPLPRKCFRTDEQYRAYREGYDPPVVAALGPEYMLNPDGSLSYNLAWAASYAWHFWNYPDALDLADQLTGQGRAA